MPIIKDLYQILGLSKTATFNDIKKAYRTLAIRYHPDKNLGHEEEANIKIKEINEAYRILADPQKRAAYDRENNTVIGSHDQKSFNQNDPNNHNDTSLQSSIAKLPTNFSIYVEGNCIDLSYINVSLTDIVNILELGSFLKKNPNITEINLSNCNFRIIPHHQQKTTWTNNIQNEGMIHGNESLNEIFQFNPGTSLNLSFNKDCKFFGFIPRDSDDNIFLNLKKLDLSHCDIGTSHFLCLFRYSRNSTKKLYSNLEVLDLSYNQILDLELASLNKLVEQSEAFVSLKILDLSYNKFSFNGLKNLLTALSQGPNNIETINFEGNNINTLEYNELCSMFPNYTVFKNQLISEHHEFDADVITQDDLKSKQVSLKDDKPHANRDQITRIENLFSDPTLENLKFINFILESYKFSYDQNLSLIKTLENCKPFVLSEDFALLEHIVLQLGVNENA